MKHTITNRLAALLLLVIGVMGCSKEETLPSGTPDTARIPITISVTDGGYEASDPSTAQSRAMENGYATTFTEGDKIGLYVVKPDGGGYAHENIELTLTDNGNGTLAWTPPAGTMLYYDAEARYFAYYPYQSTLTGDLVPSAEDAAGFFADVVSKWTPATDQSTHALYTAQDLMIGSGTVAPKQADGTCPLALTMTHAMALVVIETPTTKYSLSDDADYTWTAAAPDTKFYGFTPYSPTLGTYRYLVKSAQSGAPDLYGSYTAKNGNTKEYIIEQNGIAPANYAYYKVDGGTTKIIEKTHTLVVGDFYLKDGSLLGKDASLTNAQKGACLGVVFYVGDIKGDNYGLLDGKFSGITHGLVAAVQNLRDPDNADKQKMLWTYGGYDEFVSDWLSSAIWSGGITRPATFTSIKEENKMQGYANTLALQEYNKVKESQSQDNKRVKPIYALAKFVESNPTPASSSGWYWPSICELKGMCWGQGNGKGTAGRDLLNNQLQKVSGTKFDSSSWYYWSSTEYSSDSGYAWSVGFYDGSVYHDYEGGNEFSVRPVLAF